MPSFRKWVEYEVKKRWNSHYSMKGPDQQTIYATYDAIREKAEQRGRHVLIQAMGVEKSFELNADLHHAINVVVQAVVAGVFGEIPLTEEEKTAKLDAFKAIADPAAGLTMKTLIEAVEQLKQYKAPAPKGPHVGQAVEEGDGWKVWDGSKWIHGGPDFWASLGPVTMGKGKAAKSGLPAAQDAVKAEEAALGQLLAKVEQKSDELLGIKQKAKYEELAGIDPEEI